MGIPCPKPSKGVRLRTKKAVQEQDKRDYAEVCRVVNQRDQYRCVACGNGADPRAASELQRGHHHHVQFRSRGGQDVSSNLCLLCALCHADVHDRKLFISGNADTRLVVRRVLRATPLQPVTDGPDRLRKALG